MVLQDRIQIAQALAQIAATIPPNLAGTFSLDQEQVLFRDMFQNMVWPQVVARLPFEERWARLQKMYEVKRETSRPRQNVPKENQTIDMNKDKETELADTIIFDTVDRLKNLNYFIAWKESPVQYNRPRYTFSPFEDEFYNPTTRKVQAANGILDWNNESQGVQEKHLKLAQAHYLYGISFVFSDFRLEIDVDQSTPDFLLVKNIGTTFEPISIRRLWLNPLLPVDEMEKQTCPFFFDLVPRAQIQDNKYDPNLNPIGYSNLDKLASPQYLYGPESKAWTDALPPECRNVMTQMRPEFSGEALWTFYPLLKLPGTNQTKRYIVQVYANNLFAGAIVPIRIQELYYPRKRLPIYGVSHIPDLDSGMYTPSIAQLLEPHYDELVRAKKQFLLNKDWINDPTTEVMVGSPAANATNLNKPGAVIEVNGINDITRRAPYDATQTTLEFINQVREAAQTSGKAVDAILGKAMGGRTTATEASNAFQASMSGVTSDVDHFCTLYKEYARRVWENAGTFIPPIIRDRICGQSDAPTLSAQDFMLQIGITADAGSTFIESIVKQQHYQQAIASATTSPCLDQAVLWRALFRELKLTDALDAVQDGGQEIQITIAYDQAVQTYMGKPVAIDPSQDHQIAIKVKTRFLQDTESEYNIQYAGNPSPVKGLTVTQYLAQQIQIHQQFAMIQMQQQMLLQEAQQRQQIEVETNAKIAQKGPQFAAKSQPGPQLQQPQPQQGTKP